ncbi:hypothetical protein NE848_06005 [Gramella jeungdoensis]|uniref:Uncharacterized protein n=1 Tax=Gramella jeungdoensis TaxID=708091 RepID=A0ABT0YZM7_9FLAO|nr:hypothetical protein [Gramella jeungdoensis]MCM8568922.1 hypothetical protein [Gramella jeungdoensis]
MNAEDKIYQVCRDGMLVADVRKRSSVNFINELRENELIVINRKGKIRLTSKGKVARNMGLSNYLEMDELERELLTREVSEIRSENKGLIMVLGGLLISFIFFLGYWFVNFQN